MPKTLMCPPELFTKDLAGKTAIVTGANSGIGRITSEQLAKQGALVVLACRNVAEGERVAQELRQTTPTANVEVSELNLANLASIRSFAVRFLKQHDSLHWLINNAGVMNTPHQKTDDGFEMQLGVNHLGHFLLTELLIERLQTSGDARVINIASCYHDKAMGRDGDIHFDDLHFEHTKYDGWTSYAQSKLANVLFTQELAKRLESSSVTSVSVHPGWVRTNLMRHSMPSWVQNIVLRPVFSLMGMIEAWEGAQTSLYAALSPNIPEHSGEFFSQVGMYRNKSKNSGGWPLVSPNPNAHDADKAARLWQVSEELVGLSTAADGKSTSQPLVG